MILILTASIMYWSLQQPGAELESTSTEGNETPDTSSVTSVDTETDKELASQLANMTSIDDAAIDSTVSSRVSSPKGEADPAKEWHQNASFSGFLFSPNDINLFTGNQEN